jgi:NAD(P)-dependent dehydrogenase (short-subunit alcohol dehydrogenase family)
MDLGLSGKRAVVTGASKGIGLAIARGLVAEGAYVVAGARRETDELRDLAGGGQVRFVAVDLATAEGPSELVRAATADGGIDVLVNNVGGVKVRTGGFAAIADEEWLATLNLTFMAAVRMTRAALPALIAADEARIVNVASVNSFLPDPGVIDYSAAKAGLASFSKSISKELGPHGIRVNCVSPGPVETDLWLGDSGVARTVAQATGGAAQDVVAEQSREAATGRFTTPEEVADLVVLLAGNRAANVTGADFVIDGGLIQTL